MVWCLFTARCKQAAGANVYMIAVVVAERQEWGRHMCTGVHVYAHARASIFSGTVHLRRMLCRHALSNGASVSMGESAVGTGVHRTDIWPPAHVTAV